MKYKIEHGTDGACMALYDQHALPENYDSMEDGGDSSDIFDIEEDGNCAIIHTDGDGSHWLHLYVDEAAPDKYKKFSINHIEMKKLNIPSGKLNFTGCEYMNNKELNEDKEDSDVIKINPGSYEADIHFLQYPDNFIKAYTRKKLSSSSKLILKIHQLFGLFSLIGIFIALILMIEKTIMAGLLFLLPLLIWISMFQLSSFIKADDEKEALFSELPNVLAELNKRN